MDGWLFILTFRKKNSPSLLGEQLCIHQKAPHRPGPMVLQQGLERRLMTPPGREMVRELLRDLFRAFETIIKPERDAHILDGDVNGADVLGDRERGDPHGERECLITARQNVFSATHRQDVVRAAWPNGTGRLGTTNASVAEAKSSTRTSTRTTTPRRFPRTVRSVQNGCRPPCVPKWRTGMRRTAPGRRRQLFSTAQCTASGRALGP
jgi:hypothetical protein